MELRHLRYFVAVAEELHFGRAAERLHISQPPLSQQIQALEAELGVRLFERSRRKVALSEAGRHLLAEARTILSRAESCRDIAQQAARGVLGRLEIGFTGSSPFNDMMPRLIARFRRQWPGVELTLSEMATTAQLEALAAGRLDIGFARPAGQTLPRGLAGRRVLREPLVVALVQDHPLVAGRSDPERPVSLAGLRDDPFIAHPREIGTGLFDKAVMLCERAGFRPRVALEAKQMSTIVGLAATGLGVAIVPKTLRRLHLEGLAFAEIDDPDAYIDLVVIHRADDPSLALRNFLAQIPEEA